MRIGIDIDDTITKTHEYVIYLKKTYLNEYDPNEKLPDDVFIPFIDKYERDIHRYAELKEGVKEALDYLHECGHEIVIMSARGSYYKTVAQDTAYDDSYQYFKKNSIYFDKMITNLNDKTKSALENKIDLFIDDNIKICESVSNAGIRVIKMARFDDRECNLDIAHNWEDIINKIEEMN